MDLSQRWFRLDMELDAMSALRGMPTLQGRPLARVCWFALYMQGKSCFPGGLPLSNTGIIALNLSPQRMLSSSMVGDLEPMPSFYLSKHLE